MRCGTCEQLLSRKWREDSKPVCGWPFVWYPRSLHCFRGSGDPPNPKNRGSQATYARTGTNRCRGDLPVKPAETLGGACSASICFRIAWNSKKALI